MTTEHVKTLKTIAIDFDGVIHQYSKGWNGGEIYDPPVPGALTAIEQLQKHFAVFIFTSRYDGQVADWMKEQGFDAVGDDTVNYPNFWNDQNLILCTNRKLPAVAYIDDRGIRFVNWIQTLSMIDKLYPFFDEVEMHDAQ